MEKIPDQLAGSITLKNGGITTTPGMNLDAEIEGRKFSSVRAVKKRVVRVRVRKFQEDDDGQRKQVADSTNDTRKTRENENLSVGSVKLKPRHLSTTTAQFNKKYYELLKNIKKSCEYDAEAFLEQLVVKRRGDNAVEKEQSQDEEVNNSPGREEEEKINNAKQVVSTQKSLDIDRICENAIVVGSAAKELLQRRSMIPQAKNLDTTTLSNRQDITIKKKRDPHKFRLDKEENGDYTYDTAGDSDYSLESDSIHKKFKKNADELLDAIKANLTNLSTANGVCLRNNKNDADSLVSLIPQPTVQTITARSKNLDEAQESFSNNITNELPLHESSICPVLVANKLQEIPLPDKNVESNSNEANNKHIYYGIPNNGDKKSSTTKATNSNRRKKSNCNSMNSHNCAIGNTFKSNNFSNKKKKNNLALGNQCNIGVKVSNGNEIIITTEPNTILTEIKNGKEAPLSFPKNIVSNTMASNIGTSLVGATRSIPLSKPVAQSKNVTDVTTYFKNLTAKSCNSHSTAKSPVTPLLGENVIDACDFFNHLG